MARVFLDYAYEQTNSGTRIFAVYFNDVTKIVEADFVKVFSILDDDFVNFPPVFAPSGQIYDECFGLDRYQVFKSQVFPFGQRIVTPNSPVCATGVLNSVLYRFDTGPSGPLGDAIEDTCSMDGVGYLYFLGTLEVGTEVYQDEDLTPLAYNGNGWFLIGLSAYRINTDAEIISITPAYCGSEEVPPLPDPEPLPDIEADPFFHLPVASSLRLIKDEAVAVQTQDNTLLADQRYPGIIMQRFDQVVKEGETLTIQWGSSYETNELKVYDKLTDALIETIPAVKVLENLNQEITVPGFAVSDPEIVGVQLFFPNYPFPDFAIPGNKVNVQSPQINGQFNVISVQDGRGQAKGNRVIVIDFTIPTPSPVGVAVSGKYNAEPYDVYEAEIEFPSSGRFYVKIECTDAVFDPVSATSEPIRVTDRLEEYLEVNYTNDNDEYGCYYGNEIVHRLWIKSRLFQTFPGGEKTLNRETNAKLVKLDEYITKSLLWQVFGLPPYLVTQVSVALSHDVFKVSGVSYQTEEVPSTEYFSAHNLANMEVRLEEVDFTERNREGGTINSSDSFLLVNNAGNRLIINP
jgi:hypothetical protein